MIGPFPFRYQFEPPSRSGVLLLRKLEQRGLITLPPRQTPPPHTPHSRRARRVIQPVLHATDPVREPLRDLRPVSLQLVGDSLSRDLFSHLLCQSDLGTTFSAGYGKRKFTPESVGRDKRRKWKTARIYHGGKYREVRYKEVRKVLWQGGGRRRLLRLIVIAPVAYRTTKKGRQYYRQKACLLCTDHDLPVETLLQKYY